MAVFSVIISVFNKEPYIQDTIESVLNQSFDKFELIVVNDGSTDRSLEIIESVDDNRLHIITTSNLGASSSRNTGIKAAQNQYIALLDGDDLWDEDFLKEIYHCIQKYPEQSVFSTALAQKYESKIVPSRYNFEQKTTCQIHNYFKSSLGQSILSSSSLVFDKGILKTTGYFNTSIISGQDTDMWIRIGIHYDIVFINKILAYYRYVPNSLSNTTFDLQKKPNFESYKTFEADNGPLKRFLDINRYSLALMSKINDQKEAYVYFKSNLDMANLPLTKKALLLSPKWVLKGLLKIKSLKKERLYYRPL
jgi:glycosyltransferase involved in cell wall biosynthesis